MKKILSSLLCLVFILLCLPEYVKAERYVPITFDCNAKVLEVIDGDTIKVSVWETGEVGLVRLIGISANGDSRAFRYLTETLLGNIVTLNVDSGIKTVTGIWNNLHVIKNNENISQRMLSLGYVNLNQGHSTAYNYNTLYASVNNAYANKTGIWREPVAANQTPETYTGEKININTATSSQITSFLVGIPTIVANNIVIYRTSNPFDSINELKFVDGFTREHFNTYERLISVTTNVRTASEAELRTLRNFNSTDVNNIIRYREAYGILSVSDIQRNQLISNDKYLENLPYISVVDKATISHVVPQRTVNLNEASQEQFEDLGLTSNQANLIIEHRSEYKFKTLSELSFIPDGNFSTLFINAYEDNFLLQRYGVYVNLNTATFQQLRDIGIPYLDAERVFNMRGRIRTWADMPADLSRFNDQITLYTNINLASETELLSLNVGMTEDIVKKIIEMREEQPFGSLDEVRSVFSELEKTAVYVAISGYIVVR